MTADAKSPRRKRTVLEVLGQIRQPKVAVMLALGFASGLPFLLTREGCSVDHAARGEDAIAAVKVGAYDLILMDMRMPGLDGEQTSRELRRLGVVTPIVALTANAFEDDRHACLAAGMNDFLVKPLSPAALRAMLIRWAGPRGQSADGESAPIAKTSRA